MRRLLLLLPLVLLLPGRGDIVLDPPSGGDDVVISVDRSGGMGTQETSFTDPPELVLTGDGTGYRAGEAGIEVFHVDAAAVLRWLRIADAAGLLDHSTEARSATGLMDAESTTVVLDAGRGRLHHDVYGLDERSGFGSLKRYLGELLGWAGDQPATPYRPSSFRVLTEDDQGYHCRVRPTPLLVEGPVRAVAPLLPGDTCPWRD